MLPKGLGSEAQKYYKSLGLLQEHQLRVDPVGAVPGKPEPPSCPRNICIY